MPGHTVRLCTTRLNETVTPTACVIQYSRSGRTLFDHQQAQDDGAEAARAEPADEQPIFCRQVGTNQRDQDGDETHPEHRDKCEDHDPPSDVAPCLDHRIGAEHRENRQFQQMSGGI